MKEKLISIKQNVDIKLSQILDNPKIKLVLESKWFIAAQLLVLFYYISFYMAHPINMTIFSFFRGDLFTLDVLKPLSNEAFTIHSKMITLGFVLMCLLLFKRNINLTLFTVVVVGVFSLPIYELIDTYAHEELFKLGIYNSIMREGATQVNPQYTRIFLFVLGFIALTFLVVKKSTRTMSRVFMFLIAGSMIVTTFLFHLAIPMGTLKLSKSEKVVVFYKELTEVPVGYACRDKNCYLFDESFKKQESKKILINDIKPEEESKFISDAKNYFEDPKNKNQVFLKTVGNFLGTDTVFSACVFKVRDNKFLCAFDNKQMIHQGLLAKIWFSILTAAAHFFWIFFGFGLLFLHRTRKIHKVVNSNM